MKLKVMCKQCRREFNLKKTFNLRPDLVDSLGEYFNLNCTYCLTNSEYHANDVVAFDVVKGNLIGSAIGIGIIVVVSLLYWNHGYISNIGLIIGGLIIAASNMNTFTSNTNAFNNYLVTRNPKD